MYFAQPSFFIFEWCVILTINQFLVKNAFSEMISTQCNVGNQEREGGETIALFPRWQRAGQYVRRGRQAGQTMKGSSIYIYSDGLGPFSAALFAKDIPLENGPLERRSSIQQQIVQQGQGLFFNYVYQFLTPTYLPPVDFGERMPLML